MYNLFMISDPGYWEQHRRYQLERGKALEYPDDGIADQYRENLSKRKDLPCLFSYEGFEGDGRVGKLHSVQENANAGVVVVEYQLDDAFPPIPILSGATYSLFGCSGLECNRTHWTVKNIDLYKVVAEIYGEKILHTSPPSVSASVVERIWGSGNAGRPRLFISHEAAHRGKVGKLAETLNTHGISTFVAHQDVEPTSEWRNEILNALNTMTHFVALLTDGFHGSSWTNQEVGYSFGRDTPRLFVKLSKVDPSGLANAEQAVEAGWVNAVEEIVRWLTDGYHSTMNPARRKQTDDGKD